MAGQGENEADDAPDVAFTLDLGADSAIGDHIAPPDPPEAPSGPVSATEPDEGVRDGGSEADPGPGGGSVVGDDATADSVPPESRVTTGADPIERIIDAILPVAPERWDRLYAEFALTVSTDFAQAIFSTDAAESVAEIPAPVIDLVREYRATAHEPERGPWWRLMIHVTADRVIEVDYDYGNDPFPEGQLFAPEAYRADVEAYPRERLPVWLAAYIGHAGRQSRSPQRAAAAARTDRAAAVWSELAENEFPAFPVMWARWTTLAAAFAVSGSEWGPRILPGQGWFESARRSGATLCTLPNDRAVLSGGVWNAPTLDRSYNGGGPMPKFYTGAPEWVADPVLNPRAASGLLSFCYWWEGGRWYRGESPDAEDCAPAVPGVWTGETVVDIVTRVVSRTGQPEARPAIATLVAAAESGAVTEDVVTDAFGGGAVDMDGALFQFRLAGLMSEVPTAMPEQLALTRIRQYVSGRGLDTTGYPLDELVADRLDCGWMVYVPVPRGELAIGRAIFYIADDGVLEPSSSSVPPARFIAEFAKRFELRSTRGGGKNDSPQPVRSS
ncbi:hypothetical protein HGA13_01595 [Nocardia speluncae]|uniref:Uncharacterized protein n=1 Tax=Nocardia speluncae TaxID=419477 RepID=A0A846X6L5_9NOCA|nr:hypothetical protein [Nocardia speluncae]NKY31771.1 hypothetical protein [Nocardia speluncae]